MTDVLESAFRDDPTPPSALRRRRPALVVSSLAVLLIAAGLVWWNVGGTRLAASGGGYGVTVAVGEDASFGIVATKNGDGRVSLDAVSAKVSSGATARWSIYQAPPGGDGFGVWRGTLEPRWDTVPLSGFDDIAGDTGDGSTWIVGTIRADAPGVYRVSDVTIDYHAGWRTRSASAHTTACVLVYPVNTTLENLVATADPLVAQYHDCLA